jgi:hypothetical protein
MGLGPHPRPRLATPRDAWARRLAGANLSVRAQHELALALGPTIRFHPGPAEVSRTRGQSAVASRPLPRCRPQSWPAPARESLSPCSIRSCTSCHAIAAPSVGTPTTGLDSASSGVHPRERANHPRSPRTPRSRASPLQIPTAKAVGEGPFGHPRHTGRWRAWIPLSRVMRRVVHQGASRLDRRLGLLALPERPGLRAASPDRPRRGPRSAAPEVHSIVEPPLPCTLDDCPECRARVSGSPQLFTSLWGTRDALDVS